CALGLRRARRVYPQHAVKYRACGRLLVGAHHRVLVWIMLDQVISERVNDGCDALLAGFADQYPHRNPAIDRLPGALATRPTRPARRAVSVALLATPRARRGLPGDLRHDAMLRRPHHQRDE